MTGSAQAPAIELRGLVKRFGGKTVLDGMDLTAMAGDSVAVIGASGCGKSVSFKCALGLLPMDAGSVRFAGTPRDELPFSGPQALMRRSGVLFQGNALFDSLPIWENVAFALFHTGPMRRAEAYELACAKLDEVGLDERAANLYPPELSGGMQKRAAIARAVAADPEFLFFDEPTSGLDPVTAATIDRLIEDCVTRLRATTVTITHDLASVRKIANRVAMLHGGRIVWEGPVSELERSGSAHVDQFVHGRTDRSSTGGPPP